MVLFDMEGWGRCLMASALLIGYMLPDAAAADGGNPEGRSKTVDGMSFPRGLDDPGNLTPLNLYSSRPVKPRPMNIFPTANMTRGIMDRELIVGGEVVYDSVRFGACVRVGIGQPVTSTERAIGSGVAIGPRLVLTAAHLPGTPTWVFFGFDRDLFGVDQKRGGEFIAVSEVKVCGGWSQDDYKNDLMLLKLEKPPLGYVELAAVAHSENFEAMSGRCVEIAGFGVSILGEGLGLKIKRVAMVRVESADCSGPGNPLFKGHSGLEFSAKGEEGGGSCLPSLGGPSADTCDGDSGGPAFLIGRGGRRLLVGITSRPIRPYTRRCGDGGLYVRPDKYQAWIEAVAEEWDLAKPAFGQR